MSIYPFSSDATVVKIAIILVFSSWKLSAISFPVWIMFTFMSNRYNTENTDRSEAAHCRAEGCCYCSFRQVPCSCHQKKEKKIHLSVFWVHCTLWSIFAIGSNRIPNWSRAGFYSHGSKQCTSESTKIMKLPSIPLACNTPPSWRAREPGAEAQSKASAETSHKTRTCWTAPQRIYNQNKT